MTTPDLPPLPTKSPLAFRNSNGWRTGNDGYTAEQMHTYALAAIEAYKASRKPVAIVGLEKFPMSSMLVGVTGWVEHPPVRKTIMPMADLSVGEKLYRLDEE